MVLNYTSHAATSTDSEAEKSLLIGDFSALLPVHVQHAQAVKLKKITD